MIAYLVINDEYQTKRVYLDRAEADGFVDAYRATGGDLEVEEIVIGAPDAEYDGPVWFGSWSTRRKQVGERQLIVVTDGFTMLVPSAVPLGSYGYQPWFDNRPFSWRSLAAPIEYEEPPVWIDDFRYRQEWHTGVDPGRAVIHSRSKDRVEVRGTSKDAVEQLIQETALHIKGEQ